MSSNFHGGAPDPPNPYASPEGGLGLPPGAPGYFPGPPRVSPLAGVSLGLGIAGILLSCCCYGIFSYPLGIGAIVCAAVALNQIKMGLSEGKGLATAGLVCGIAALILPIVLIVIGVLLGVSMAIFEQSQQGQF